MTAKIDGTNGVLQQYDYQVSTTGFSYTFAAGTTVLVMNPAGTLATGTITMPAAPVDGMTISFSSTQAITALTVAANTGQSIVGNPTTLNAGGAATLVYRLSNTTWYVQANTASIALSTGVPVLNVYTTPGNYTKPATVKAIKVTVIGGGGGGSAAAGPASPSVGGGGGGTVIINYPAASLPASAIPYTVGTGGAGGVQSGSAAPFTGSAGNTSSFGVAPITVISATGGAAGPFGNGVLAPNAPGGVGSGGSLNMTGSLGFQATATGQGGYGGNTFLGTGSIGGRASSGPAGVSYGGGGGGSGTTGGGNTGGAGATGVVVVEEFY